MCEKRENVQDVNKCKLHNKLLEIYKPNLIEAHAIFIASWISYHKSFYIRYYSIFVFFSQVIARPPKLNFLKRTQKCISFTISCFDAKHVLENKQLHREKQNKKYEPFKNAKAL